MLRVMINDAEGESVSLEKKLPTEIRYRKTILNSKRTYG